MQQNGIIIKGIGGFYYVEVAGEIYECKARGIFRKEKIVPLVGDYVKITVNDDNKENTIDEIKERKNFIKRPPLANIDQLIIVASSCKPNPKPFIIDKLTAICVHKNIEPIIVFNKTDLQEAQELMQIYSKTEFKTFAVSGKTGEGVEELKAVLKDKTSAFTGNSGVGKSTILNCIDANLKISTAEISEKLGRGRHTTRESQLYKVAGGYVADTPGFSSLELELEKDEIIMKDELQYCFPEFEEYIGNCKFTTCSHTTDKGCKIVEAVETGLISKSRHESYKMMYDKVKNIKEWQL